MLTPSRFNAKLFQAEPQWPTKVPCKIAIVGEALGENEALVGKPFVGSSGRLLDGLLQIAGINRAECLVSNCFMDRPPSNNVMEFFSRKRVIKPEWMGELQRLTKELERVNPNCIIALGATALWVLTGLEGITKYRGTIVTSNLVPGRTIKVLPTFHPAYVLRVWDSRPIVGKDFIKARLESQTRELVRPEREVWIRPTIADLYEFEMKHMTGITEMAVDIENTWPSPLKQLTCVGFAPSDAVSICVPLMDKTKKGWSYWATAAEEREAVEWMGRQLGRSDVTKLFQNGLFDIQWLERKLRKKVALPWADTMLMHHSLQPELPKSLGELASLYTNEFSWKNLISFKKDQKAEA